MQNSLNNWINNIKDIIVARPIPHIPEGELYAIMPPELHPVWNDFSRGKTGLALDNGDFGVYPVDLDFFIYRILKLG